MNARLRFVPSSIVFIIFIVGHNMTILSGIILSTKTFKEKLWDIGLENMTTVEAGEKLLQKSTIDGTHLLVIKFIIHLHTLMQLIKMVAIGKATPAGIIINAKGDKMKTVRNIKSTLNHEVRKIARNNVIKKLEKQGLSYKDLTSYEFDELLADEVEILKSDTKKVSAGVGIGIMITMLTGF